LLKILLPDAEKKLIRLFTNWLKQPFLFPSSVFARFLISFTFGLFVFLFLRIFLPYGLSEIPVNKTLFISVYGIATTVIISIWLLIFPLFLPGMFDPKRYTIGRYFFLCFGNTMLVDIFNWIYTRTAGADILPHYPFIPFTLFTFSLGVFPVIFHTLINDKIMLIQKTRDTIKQQGRPSAMTNPAIIREFAIRNSSGAVQLHFSEKEFICARSNENYTFIFYLQDGLARKELIRIPISRFYEQVKDGPTIVRCHRCGVVNLQYVRHVNGNSRSLELELEHIDEPVAVSREFPRSLLYHHARGKEVKMNNGSQSKSRIT